jgi:polysaccharide export outer membrane protein
MWMSFHLAGKRSFLLLAIVAGSAIGCVRPLVTAKPAVELPASQTTPYDPHAATRFGPGDVFEVRLLGEADVSGAYRIAPDGTLDFPYCGRMKVDGMISSEVASTLTACLKDGKFFKDPQLVVIAKEVGANRKVFIYGNVQKAGPYPFIDNMSIIEAIALAGGFSQFAGQNQVNVIRAGKDGQEQKYKIAVQDIGLGRTPNFLLQPGDIVYVPESAF